MTMVTHRHQGEVHITCYSGGTFLILLRPLEYL